MRKIAALFAALFFPTLVLANPWPLEVMNKHIDQTNFLVNSNCSGTLIDVENRYVLTANHCVQSQWETIEREKIDDNGVVTKEKVRKLKDGTVTQFDFASSEAIRTVQYKVRLVKVDRERDLALLQIMSQIPNTKAAQLACKSPSRGETVWTVGNPMGSLYSSVSRGVISSMQRDYNIIDFATSNNEKQPLMQITSGLVGGNSGGAVYDERGRLVGVPVVGNRVNEVIGFATPRDEIANFLSTIPHTCAE